MMLAIKFGLVETNGETVKIVKLLLDKGANINAKNFGGSTALIQAAMFGQVNVVELLLARGADINAVDTHDMSALDMAKAARNAPLVQMLQQAGATDR